MTEPTAQDRVKLNLQFRLQAAITKRKLLAEEFEELAIADVVWERITGAQSHLQDTRLRMIDAFNETQALVTEIRLLEQAILILETPIPDRRSG